MIKLRTYQKTGIQGIKQSFMRGNKRVLFVAPPGSGKGTIMGSVTRGAYDKDNRSLSFMHKRELCYQLADRYRQQFGMDDIGFILAGEPRKERKVMIGSVQTITRRAMGDFPFIIGDEIHRFKTNQHMKIIQQYWGSFFVGFTATPFRTDKKRFDTVFQDIIQTANYQKLVQMKHLVPTKCYAPWCPDLTKIKTVKRDYSDKDLFDRYNQDKAYQIVVDKWKEFGENRKTIVFNINFKEHSRRQAAMFNKNGIRSEAIDSDTSPEERKNLLDAFKRGEYPVLNNIGLFTEGISIDDVSCIIFNVATKSKNKYVQAGARGSRPLWNADYSDWRKKDGEYEKENCLVLDFGQNIDRHGFIDHYDMLPFDLSGTPPKPPMDKATKTCKECGKVHLVQVRKCDECGYVFPVKKGKEKWADEFEWEEKNPHFHMVTNLSKDKLPNRLIQNVGPELLRICGLVRGYKPTWALIQAWKSGYVNKSPYSANGRKFLAKNAAGITAYLLACEKNHGYEGLYDYLKTIYK